MYINSYVIPIPEERKEDYIRIAKLYVEIARDYGAIEIFETEEACCRGFADDCATAFPDLDGECED